MPYLDDHSLNCCGWSEIASLGYWDGTKKDFDRWIMEDADAISVSLKGNVRPASFHCGAIFFTSNRKEKNNYATKFAKLIRELKLGKVVAIPRFTNPNTKNTITSYAWILDKKAITKYVLKLRKTYKTSRSSYNYDTNWDW